MKRAKKRTAMKLDPATLAVMNNRLAAIAEEADHLVVVTDAEGVLLSVEGSARLRLRAADRQAVAPSHVLGLGVRDLAHAHFGQGDRGRAVGDELGHFLGIAAARIVQD